MHTPEDIFYIVGLVIAVIELIRSKGYAWLAWAVLAVTVGLLWHLLPGQ
jgi:hypothetical protein